MIQWFDLQHSGEGAGDLQLLVVLLEEEEEVWDLVWVEGMLEIVWC